VIEQVRDVLSLKSSFISEIGPALGTHTGPGVLGIAAYGD